MDSERSYDLPFLPTPQPLSLKRRKIYTDNEDYRYGETNIDQSKMLREVEEDSYSRNVHLQPALRSAAKAFLIVSHKVSSICDLLREPIKVESFDQIEMKKENEKDLTETKLERKCYLDTKIVDTLTATKLYGIMSIWSDDMRFVFYSLLKDKATFLIEHMNPSHDALEFVNSFNKAHV